jgi:hypothetical protein
MLRALIWSSAPCVRGQPKPVAAALAARAGRRHQGLAARATGVRARTIKPKTSASTGARGANGSCFSSDACAAGVPSDRPSAVRRTKPVWGSACWTASWKTRGRWQRAFGSRRLFDVCNRGRVLGQHRQQACSELLAQGAWLWLSLRLVEVSRFPEQCQACVCTLRMCARTTGAGLQAGAHTEFLAQQAHSVCAPPLFVGASVRLWQGPPRAASTGKHSHTCVKSARTIRNDCPTMGSSPGAALSRRSRRPRRLYLRSRYDTVRLQVAAAANSRGAHGQRASLTSRQHIKSVRC